MTEEKTIQKENKKEKTKLLKKTVKLSSGSEVVVEKLKVGVYYKAQKIYSEVLTVLQSAVSVMQLDYSSYVDKKTGSPDLKAIEDKLAEDKHNSTDKMMNMFSALQKVNPLKIKMVAIVLNKEEKEIEDNFFPDDVDKIYQTVTELNDFLGNLKNSVALTASLEGKSQSQD